MTFNLAKPDRPIHVGVFLSSGISDLLDSAPIDLLAAFDRASLDEFSDDFIPAALRSQAIDLVFHWVNETGETARMTSGLRLVPTDTFESCPDLDILIVPASNVGYTPNAAEVRFVQKTAEACSAFITICGGAQIATQAGVLDGKTATGPRFFLDQMKQAAPKVNWVEKRWVRDGKIWTSGALLNGLDLMTAFIESTWDVQEGDLRDFMLKIGGKPVRDVDYKDVAWAL